MSYSTLNSGASRPPPAPGPLIADQAAALCALSQGAGGGGPEALLGTSLPISITGMLHFVPGAGEERRLQLTWASDPAATSKANMPTLPLPPRWGGSLGHAPFPSAGWAVALTTWSNHRVLGVHWLVGSTGPCILGTAVRVRGLGVPKPTWAPLWGGSQVPRDGRGRNRFGLLAVWFSHKVHSHLEVCGSWARSSPRPG